MTSDQLARLLDELRSGLSRLLGEQLQAVYLYGSQARGEARADSDVDVLVVLRGKFSYFDMIEITGQLAAELSLKYDTVVSLAFTHQEDYQERQIPFLMNIRREGIAV